MSNHHPQTPQSPSQFSPGTTIEAALSGATTAAIPSTLPTPAHSINDASQAVDAMATEPYGKHDESSSFSSNHSKRKRDADDLGTGRDSKKLDLGNGRMGVARPDSSLGSKYLFCTSQNTPPLVNLFDDVIETYGMGDVAASVARVLPNGEKNPIRKTYKGHIRRLGLSGNFEAVVSETEDETGLMASIMIPDMEWNARMVRDPRIEERRLAAATMMRRGSLKSVWDNSVLGELAPPTPVPNHRGVRTSTPGTPLINVHNAGQGPSQPRARSAVPQPHAPQPPQQQATSNPAQQQLPLSGAAAAAQGAARPQRTNKKRSYGESSFEGYGEGFADDGADTGYSTAEGEGAASGQKRRKKARHDPSSSLLLAGTGDANMLQNQIQASSLQQSYGPGMVGA